MNSVVDIEYMDNLEGNRYFSGEQLHEVLQKALEYKPNTKEGYCQDWARIKIRIRDNIHIFTKDQLMQLCESYIQITTGLENWK